MQDLQPILDKNSFQVAGLLRRHKIAGPVTVATIQTAYDRKGEQFMMELLNIITPEKTSPFLGLFEGKAKAKKAAEAAAYDPLADPLSEETYNAALAESQPKQTGKFWSFFDKMFSTTEKAGQVIGQFKTDSAGNQLPTAGQPGYVDPQASNKMIYWVAGGFIALIIIILIVKK
jgi:hypothetical protein